MTDIVNAPVVLEQSGVEETSLIQVKQIPIIIEKLESVKEKVLAKTEAAKKWYVRKIITRR